MYFLCFRVGEVVGVRLVNLCLKGTYETSNVFREAKYVF
jgi:hypothetical protein